MSQLSSSQAPLPPPVAQHLAAGEMLPTSLGRIPEALAQDLLESFDLETLAQLSCVNRVWRRAAFRDLRVRYDCARAQPQQSESLWWRRDSNAASWHSRVCQAIENDMPHLLAMLLSMGAAYDPHFYGVLTGVVPNRPAEPSYLIRASWANTPRCAHVLLDRVPHSAAGTCLQGWRASRYAEAAGNHRLWRTLRLAELAEGEALQPLPYPTEPPPQPAAHAWPAAKAASGDYRAIVQWVVQRRDWYQSIQAQASGWLADLDRAIAAMPRSESLQAKWAMRQLTQMYACALPARLAWARAVQALFAKHPRLHTSTYLHAYLPLDHETQAALEEVWHSHPLPAVTSHRDRLQLIDSVFDMLLQGHSAARVVFLSQLFVALDIGVEETAPTASRSFAQRAFALERMSFIVDSVRRSERLPGLLTTDRNVLHCLMGEIRRMYYDSAMRHEEGIRQVVDIVAGSPVLDTLCRNSDLLLQRDAMGKTPALIVLELGEHLRFGIELLAPVLLLNALLTHGSEEALAQSLCNTEGIIDTACGCAIQDILESKWIRAPDHAALARFLNAQRRPVQTYRQKVVRNIWYAVEPQL